jgi:predicted dehydrogenase
MYQPIMRGLSGATNGGQCAQGFQLRFLTSVNAMRQLVDEGYLGRLLTMEARVSMGSLVRGEVSCGAGANGIARKYGWPRNEIFEF